MPETDEAVALRVQQGDKEAFGVTTGETVTVMGTPNPDGSLTANSIQIRPDRAGLSR